jgi:two-component system phosphate regulon sensor histidine kinase PhoR
MSRIQWKIMGTLTVLILVVVGASGFFAERAQRDRITNEIRLTVEHHARLFALLVEDVGLEPANAARLQALAVRGAEAVDARVTLIDAAGRVVADSEVPFDLIGELANHGDRPEVIEALRDGIGHARRRSDTLKRELLYVALRVPERKVGGGDGIVRMAVGLEQIGVAVAELRRELVVAGGLGLVVALGLSYLLSLLTLRPIEELREVVADIAAGKLGRRLGWDSNDERGQIAASINRLARQLRDSIDQAARDKLQLEAVLKGMAEGVIVIDRGDKVQLANPRAQELLSIWGDYEGRPVPEVIRSPEIDQALSEASESDDVVVREVEVHADKRRVLLMHASGFPKANPRSGTVAVFHDVSELRRVDEVRRDFIANASHELRTPLTSIQGFADTLRSSQVGPEQQAQYLEVIVRNAQRMSSLIDDLLTLSRLESGPSRLDRVPVDVRRVVETVVADFGPRYEEAEIELVLHEEPVPICSTDQDAVEQVLSNLLSNAVRYSNAGSRVDVFVREAEGHIEIRVEDTGIGIPAEDLERIFERFYRVDTSRSRALGSTGLGLSIVKHLVRSLGGEIRVESQPGRGSKFAFTLPLR